MRAIALTNYLALTPTAQAGANAILTALGVVFIVASIIGLGRRAALIPLLLTMITLYVGYRSACWPEQCGQGLLGSLWDMFWGSIRVLWDSLWDALGVDSFADRIGFK